MPEHIILFEKGFKKHCAPCSTLQNALRVYTLKRARAPAPCYQAGISVDDVDIYEINEAFASQALYCIETLKIPMAKARWERKRHADM